MCYSLKHTMNIMKTTKTILMALGVAAMFTACSSRVDENPAGSWTSAAPATVTAKVADATSASKVLTFDFVAPDEVTLTADYDVTATVATDSVPWTVSYMATASVKGTYNRDSKDDDEYLLSFDTNTLSVSGTDAPELGPVTDEFLSSLAQFTKIDDVKVSKDGKHLTFEAGHPDVEYHFVSK